MHFKKITDVPWPDLGTYIGPIPIKKWAKTSKNGAYHSQFLSSTFWRKFHESPYKNCKVTDAWKFASKCEWKHVFIYIFMQIFMSFYEGQLKQQICYSFTLLISCMVLINLKWRSSSFRLHQVFQILMVQMLFPEIQQAPPCLNLRYVGKILTMFDRHPFTNSTTYSP